MKHIFIPNANGTHVRTVDNVRGNLRSFQDNVTVNGPHPVLDNSDGIVPYVAPKLRTLTKRELVDRLIAAGIAAQFNTLLNELPLAEKLRWEASPTISPDYPFIKDNDDMICAKLNITTEELYNLFR
jgi:hypothetical protein